MIPDLVTIANRAAVDALTPSDVQALYVIRANGAALQTMPGVPPHARERARLLSIAADKMLASEPRPRRH
jgi:hypothetical protein